MTVVRALARPLMSVLFIVQGSKALRDPEPHVKKAQPVGDRIPESTKTLVRLNGAAQILGGVAIASGSGRRVGAAVLAGSLVPTTLAEHRFWEEADPEARANQKVQFMKNLGVFGGLLLAAVDTEGKPGVAWRTKHGAIAAKRETKRAGKLAKRETKQFARTARREAKLAARSARAELPFR